MKYLKICHRLPERSFHIKGHQFPVCSRCTGFYTGLFVFLVYEILFGVYYNLELFLISIILMIPVAVDGFTQLFGLRESNNTLRFITGFIGGIGLIIFIRIAFFTLFFYFK